MYFLYDNNNIARYGKQQKHNKETKTKQNSHFLQPTIRIRDTL